MTDKQIRIIAAIRKALIKVILLLDAVIEESSKGDANGR